MHGYVNNDNLPWGNIALQYDIQTNCRKVWWCFLMISSTFLKIKIFFCRIHQNYLVDLMSETDHLQPDIHGDVHGACTFMQILTVILPLNLMRVMYVFFLATFLCSIICIIIIFPSHVRQGHQILCIWACTALLRIKGHQKALNYHK